ncbi:ABC transporter permease [Diaminobutyricibacter tongyongensis]|uniref:ABC transporter permease n=1 Tax=Leifsonia tongyongensis TaxID=1268043 RepID=A0A6L9XVL4_9MICO|nr:ABC transporter permease [Diaminobutyricibacter tongyongensis]NEN05480.1 ABC transporter permease [Diaminobutyricibacter tongyongensis]
MLRFILRRLFSGIVLLFVITTIAYVLLYLGGGNIARRILGTSATQANVQAKAASLGLDRPLIVQYIDWLGNALHGDFGASWFTGQPVADAISSRAAVTLSIVIGATVLSAIVAVILGVWAAVRRGGVDRSVQVLSVLGFAIPGFLIALGLVLIFAINLHWFKPTGYIPFTDSPSGWLSSVTLPIIALAIGSIAGVTQQIRGSVIDALRQDYVRTLRSRGLSSSRVIYKHVLRNAGGPALAILAVQFIGLLGGAVIVEQIFAIPGLGQVSVSATTQGDIPLVMGLVVITAIIVVVVNLLIDLLQGWLNPKVRLS